MRYIQLFEGATFVIIELQIERSHRVVKMLEAGRTDDR